MFNHHKEALAALLSLGCAAGGFLEAFVLCSARYAIVGSRRALMLLLAIASVHVAAQQVKYVYDEAGRLVEVVAPNGEVARYAYDPAGNIKSIRRFGASALSIAEFTPNQAPPGATVNVHGSGFSATPAQNAVKFNGQAAVVSSSTSTQLTVTVPAGATTGPISVTVGGNTAVSADPFTVAGSTGVSAPTISAFSPDHGGAGTAVTISGTNFDPIAGNNLVTLNGRPVSITSATATQIVVAISTEATSGPFRVATAAGSATSASDFFAPPPGDIDTNIVTRTRLVVDGPSVAASGVPASRVAIHAFAGAAGQRLGLGISEVSSSSGYSEMDIRIFAPNGSLLSACGNLYVSGGGCILPPLPQAGTYVLRVGPSSISGSTSYKLTLSTEIAAELPVNGTQPTLFTSSRPGQNGRYVFQGIAGASYSIQLGDASVSSAVLVYGPGGQQIGTGSIGPGLSSTIDINGVLGTGAYSVVVDPDGANTGQLSLLLSTSVTGTLMIDGAAEVVSLSSGQNARYAFQGAIGQRLGLGLSTLATMPAGGSVAIKVFGPTGVLLVACNNGAAYTTVGRCTLPRLEAAGTYTVLIDPPGPHSASTTLLLSSEVAGVLVVDASTATTFSTNRVGQAGRYTFSGIAGKRYSLVPSGYTFPGPYTSVAVYSPTGALVASANMAAWPGAPLDIVNTPTTGPYSVVVEPYGANIGELALRLISVAEGSLSVDGSPVNVSLAGGQNGRYTFTGAAGQKLGLGITSFATTPVGGSANVSVLGPTGVVLVACSVNRSNGCNLPPLPESGQFTVVVDPQVSSALSAVLTLSRDVGGALTINATSATTLNTTRPGQNGRYTFTGAAGGRYSLAITNVTIPGAWTNVSVIAPNGSLVGMRQLTAGIAPFAYDFDTSVAGTYTVFIDPFEANTGQVTLSLSSTTAVALPIDGSSVTATLVGGQNRRYTFTGSVGQQLGLGLTAMSTTPSGGSIDVKVLAPSGEVLITCGSYAASAGSAACSLPRLPAAGTYTVLVDPQTTYAASVTLTLSRDIAGTLTVDAATATTFSTARPGQNGRYTFNGVAGFNYALQPSNITVPGEWTIIRLYAPDGTPLGSSTGSSTTPPSAIALNNAPATGAYVIVIDPYLAGTGSVDIRVSQSGTTDPAPQTPNGTLVIDGAATSIAMPANQVYRYTFSGTQGQTLGLGGGWLTTSPSGKNATLTITRPDNLTTLTTCIHLPSGFSCNIPKLPSTGTYTVRVQPDPGAAITSGALTLSKDLTGVLLANAGTPTTFNTARPGQNGRFTFSATAGKPYSLVWSTTTIWGTHPLIVYRPDGEVLGTGAFQNGTGVWDLPPIPASGTYTVLIDPVSANVGQLDLSLRQGPSGTLAIDGATTPVSLIAWQNGRYTFAGTAGKFLGLGITNAQTVPSGGSILLSVYDPTGSLLKQCNVGSFPLLNCNLGPLPWAGTYSVFIDPQGSNSASLSLMLSNEVTGTLTPNPASPTVFSSSRPGQNARYTFSGVARQRLALHWFGSTFPSGSVSVYKPDGGVLNSANFGGGGAGALNLGELPAPGSYVVVLDPEGMETGQVSIALREANTAALALDGSALAVALAPGQQGRYTFSASAGQHLGLAIMDLATVPAGKYITVNVYDSTGELVTYCGSLGTGWACDIGPVRRSGDHTVVITPDDAVDASLSLLLSSDFAGGALDLNAVEPTTVNITRPGRNARYTFGATAGDEMTLLQSGLSAFVKVLRPDGMQQAMAWELAGSLQNLGTLSVTGDYTVVIDAGLTTGSMSIAARRGLLRNAVVDDSAVQAVTLLSAQRVTFAFSAIAGSNLGVVLSDLSTSPAAPSSNPIAVILSNARGQVLKSCVIGAEPNPGCKFPTLPETGTYKVMVSPGPNAASFGFRIRSTI
ncbi:IPT/TIG domain-containing protein [Aquabacterium humicola]|uniref:IPT/TIG domain-containing protein n=1 Tax=Aquabacterium humicola TaxID=3237377 RepID=UPI0025437BBD|nr:IPT/TIG domain-containing protein [Rubrivivax pictus]